MLMKKINNFILFSKDFQSSYEHHKEPSFI